MNINLIKTLKANTNLVITDVQLTSFYKFRLMDFENNDFDIDETNECLIFYNNLGDKKTYYLDVTDIDIIIAVPKDSTNYNPINNMAGSPSEAEIKKGNIKGN